MDLSITVSAKWYPEKRTKYGTLPSGWICKSSNPEIETERFENYVLAFNFYMQQLKENWLYTWENFPSIETFGPYVRGKSNKFLFNGMDEFSLTLPKDEVGMSWSIILSRAVNRTLGEFGTDNDVDTILKAANHEDAGKIVDTITKITEIAEETGLSPETIFNTAMAELQRQKSGKSVFEQALPELEKLGEEQGFTVSLQKGSDPAGEEA